MTTPLTTQATWQQSLSQAITDPLALLQLLNLESHYSEKLKEVTQLFPLRVPHCFIDRMEKGNINDPLLRQILPIEAELADHPGYTSDPVGDNAANKIPGLLQKYQGRVLLTLAGTCAVNCRYCFRRAFPYSDNNPGRAGWQKVVEAIAEDSSITEVIWSGGDPLIQSDKSLASLCHLLAEIPHVKTLRIHSRLPVVLPDRITPEFIKWFSGSRLKPVMVIHSNHSNELDHTVAEAVFKMRQAQIMVLNQSVLLKGINDTAEILIQLSKRLFEIDVLPYYLHLLDKVSGSQHFDVAKTEALYLQKELLAALPGYLVPRFVTEEAGALSKIALEKKYVSHC